MYIHSLFVSWKFTSINSTTSCIFFGTVYTIAQFENASAFLAKRACANKDDKWIVDLKCFIYHSVQCLRFVSSSKVQYKVVLRKVLFSFVRRTHQTSRKLYLLRRNVASATSICVQNMCTDTCNYNFYIKRKDTYVCVSIR